MKRKLLLSTLMSLMLIGSAWAQRTITGTVSDATQGALPGATVQVKGTNTGTTTDLEGKYSITVAEGSDVLIFRFIGYGTKEETIGNRSVIDITLSDDIELTTVVVTALGVSREKQSLGYATQEIKGDNLVQAREMNVVNSLNGKVAGVQITGSNSIGGSSRVVIRGNNSITGENQPLFVVDGVPMDNSNFTTTNQARGVGGVDYGNAAQDINPNDIESVNVLKGAAASALYGSRGQNGVILITTKKGTKRNGIGVTFNTGIQFQDVYILPDYQNKYGTAILKDANGNNITDENGNAILNYGYDGSWGSPLDGTMVRHWDSFNPEDTENFGKARPFVASPDNVRDFFDRGSIFSNSLALSGGSEAATFRLSYTNVNQQGTYPGSEIKRNTLSFNGSSKLSDKLSANVGFNYVKTEGRGRPTTGYNGIMSLFNQWYQRQLDTDRLRNNYIASDGSQISWNRKSATNAEPNYWDNPFWMVNQNYTEDNSDRMYGNASVTYKILPWLNATGRAMVDIYTNRREERQTIGSKEVPFYREDLRTVADNNYDFILNATRNLTEDLSLVALVGSNTRIRNYNRNFAGTQDGLNVPNYFNVGNSAGVAPQVIDASSTKIVNSIFGSASFGYQSTFYLDITGRNDWSSTLPTGNNSYFYPSFTGSFIFSEKIKADWLSFGKIRAGYAQVGNDTDPYRISTTYEVNQNFGSNGNMTVPNSRNNPNLRPEKTNSWEIGTEVSLFKNRVALDLTYYNSVTKDQIFGVPVSPTTGYTNTVINAGSVSNQGIEAMLNLKVLRLTSGFTWDATINWARNRNKVVSLAEGISTLRLASLFGVYLEAREGESYGVFVGPTIAKHTDGKYIVDTDGRYVLEPTLGVGPSIMADWTGGINNTFNYKNFMLSVLVDAQKGGSIYSLTNMWGHYSGTLKETAEGTMREDGVVIDAVVQTGVNEDGYPISDGSQNTTSVDAVTWGQDYYAGGGGNTSLNVFDASYVKLREIQFGYTFPKTLISKTPFQRASLSFVARNVAILFRNTPHIDPQDGVSSGNVQGFEGGQLPTERSWGFNLSLSF